MPKSFKYLLLIAALLGAALWLTPKFSSPGNAPGKVPQVVDFNYHVKPILSDRCFKCHGPDKDKREQELGLHTEEGLFKALKDDSTKFVVVPGKPMESALFLRISSHDTAYHMPPPESNLSLTETEIATIKRWIEQGAKYKKHWAFLPPEKAELPKVSYKKWAKNEIDFFVLEKLEDAGLSPNEPADKERLLRRLSYDLTGLPPSVELAEKFLADNSPDAVGKIMDEFFKMPAYGEQQASHWLDVARYADSHGYQDDSYRSMWPWRDWVIHAFNKNLSYKEFITWQLAGDLLPPTGVGATKEQLLATGFLRNHKITQEGGVIEEEYRLAYAADKTNTFGKAMLGITFECASCHDHKYDPISQKEYYATFAFFNQSIEKGFYGDVSNVSTAEPPVLIPTEEELKGVLNFINRTDADTVVSMVMGEDTLPRRTFVLKRGQYDQPTDSVQIGTPAAMLAFPANLPKNRLGLSEWMFDEKNPLTARVFVNRLWQEIFGAGLVKSSDNFGNQGDLPSHPKLLDWLATDFREHGWDIQHLLKKIMTSATYCQSAAADRKKLEIDPENRLLSRSPRNRLTPEQLRDTWLAASGLLQTAVGGPSVRPYQPPGLWEDTNAGEGRGSLTKYKQDTTAQRLYRRTLYTIWKRTLPHPMMTTFDAPIRDNCSVKRLRTNTPLQALNLMNDPQMLEASRFFAEQLLKDNKLDDAGRMELAFRRVLCRKPTSKEAKLLTSQFSKRKEELAKSEEVVNKLLTAGFSKPDGSVDGAACAALMEVVQMIFNMDEAISKS